MYHFLFLAFSVFTTNNYHLYTAAVLKKRIYKKTQLECGPMTNVMSDLPTVGGALC